MKQIKALSLLWIFLLLFSCDDATLSALLGTSPTGATSGATTGTRSGATTSTSTGARVPRTLDINVNNDGTFSPAAVTIRPGDTVRWNFSTPGRDSVIPIASPSLKHCGISLPHSTGKNQFTGPNPYLVAGIYSRSPDEEGYVATTKNISFRGKICSVNDNSGVVTTDRGSGTAQWICPVNPEIYATMDSTWQHPDIVGVYIQLSWEQLQPSKDAFITSDLERELDKAVKHGKYFSIGIEAGKKTPHWIFNSGQVPEGQFIDGGSEIYAKIQGPDGSPDPSRLNEFHQCGTEMSLGSPFSSIYQEHYHQALTKLANVIKQKNSWYRALTQIKLGGMNMLTPEGRLPVRCNQDILDLVEAGAARTNCTCNTKEWVEIDYSPSALYSFYEKQAQHIQSLFPGKEMSYMLIQNGFPRVSEVREFKNQKYQNYLVTKRTKTRIFNTYYNRLLTKAQEETETERFNGKPPIPTQTEQTENILQRLTSAYPEQMIVQHNGLKGTTTPSECFTGENDYQLNIPTPYGEPNPCPNYWANLYGYNNFLSGFQTINSKNGVGNPEELAAAFKSLMELTRGYYLEAYEQRLWESYTQSERSLTPRDPRSLSDWAQELYDRRASKFPTHPDARVNSYSYTFQADGEKDYYFVNPYACQANIHPGPPSTAPTPARFGLIQLRP